LEYGLNHRQEQLHELMICPYQNLWGLIQLVAYIFWRDRYIALQI
jgi:hypothetical protein